MSCCLLNSRKNRRLFPHLRFPLQILSEINLKKKSNFKLNWLIATVHEETSLIVCAKNLLLHNESIYERKKALSWEKIWFKIQKSWCLPARKNMCMDEIDHGLRTPNEGINQWYLKNWADMADTIRFGRT